jgi:taurine dioxygenase
MQLAVAEAAAVLDGIIGVRPLSAAVGAEVTGVDLAHVGQRAFAAIRAAWLEHSALLFRDQTLTDADLVAFSRRFGELDVAPVMESGRTAVPGHPEIHVVANVLGADRRPTGSLDAAEAAWHSDMSYLPVPPDAAMLHALEVPPASGDTWLSSMAAACDALPKLLKAEVRGRSIKHDRTCNSGGFLRAGARASDNPIEVVGQPHPIICRHPETGREVLFLGRRRNAYVLGLPLDESEALLEELWRHATRLAFAFAHRWREGDLLLWDNRSTMHRCHAFDPATRRVLHRTQIKGRVQPIAA